MLPTTHHKLSKFKGDLSDYPLWKFKLGMVLLQSKLQHTIKPKSVQLTAAEAAAWDADQEPAKAIIVLSLADNQLVKIMKASTALEMITILDSEFESKAVVNKIILKKRLFSFRLEEGKSLSSYVNDFDALLLQLAAVNVVVDPEDAAIQLLVGLPPSYGALVTALETNTNNLKFEVVRAALLNEELKQKYLLEDQRIEGALVASQGGDKKKSPPTTNKHHADPHVCKHCKRGVHPEEKCWVKHPHLRPSGDKAPSNNTRREGKARECLVTVISCNLAADKRNVKINSWTIDSGATSHMSFNHSLFSSYKSTERIPVKIENAEYIYGKGIGDIVLPILVNEQTKKVCLTNVVYVPSLWRNLLSTKAVTSYGASVEFRKENCLIQNSQGHIVAEALLGPEKLYNLAQRAENALSLVTQPNALSI